MTTLFRDLIVKNCVFFQEKVCWCFCHKDDLISLGSDMISANKSGSTQVCMGELVFFSVLFNTQNTPYFAIFSYSEKTNHKIENCWINMYLCDRCVYYITNIFYENKHLSSLYFEINRNNIFCKFLKIINVFLSL